jgi:hypothetical protein
VQRGSSDRVEPFVVFIDSWNARCRATRPTWKLVAWSRSRRLRRRRYQVRLWAVLRKIPLQHGGHPAQTLLFRVLPRLLKLEFSYAQHGGGTDQQRILFCPSIVGHGGDDRGGAEMSLCGERRNAMSVNADGDLLVRVRKLLDKAEATTNAHEADAFSRKAAELIAAHRIDPDRLAAVDAGDDLRVRDIEIGRGAYVRARLALFQAIAEANDVRIVFQARPHGTVVMAAGFRSDLDVVEVLYTSLHQQASSQMAGVKRQTGAATQKFRRSFLFGFADRIGEVLSESKRHAEEQVRSSDAAVTSARALATTTRNERVEEFATASFGRVRTARAPSAAQVGGWGAGAAAASQADVGRTRLRGRRAIDRAPRS